MQDTELVSTAIRERGGYKLMPEWGTNPANHYLPRRKTEFTLSEDQITRADNPIKVDERLPKSAMKSPALNAFESW